MATLRCTPKAFGTKAAVAALVVLGTAALLAPVSALAFDVDNPPERIFGGNELLGVVMDILRIVVLIAGTAVIVGILWSGITYLTAGANEDKKKGAKHQLKMALIGAAIIVGFSVIIATVEGVVSGDFFSFEQVIDAPPAHEVDVGDIPGDCC